MKVKRSHALVVLLGLGVTGIVGVSAASLGGLDGADMGADAAVVASCDTDGLDVNYTTEANGFLGGPSVELTGVELGEINPLCAGQEIEVTLFDIADAPLGSATVTATAAATQTVPFSGVDAEEVEGIAVVISELP